LDKHTTILNNKQLSANFKDCHNKEVPVVEEAFENVEFALAQFSGVELIENLHPDESIENNCE